MDVKSEKAEVGRLKSKKSANAIEVTRIEWGQAAIIKSYFDARREEAHEELECNPCGFAFQRQ